MSVTGLGGETEPVGRFGAIAADAGAGEVEHAERACRGTMPGISGATEPHRRFGVIRRQIATFGIKVADQGRGLAVAGEGRAPQP